MFDKLALLLVQAIDIYSYLLLIWVIGSWFPRIQGNKVYIWIASVVYPYAQIFRRVVPPLGGFDFSVILAYLVLMFVRKLVASLLFSI